MISLSTKHYICVLFPLLIILSCKKEPSAIKGPVTLTVEVKHHTWAIANSKVFIKNSTTEFPGKDPSKYDWCKVTDENGFVQFAGLFFGNYYLFTKGYDKVIFDSVIGYKPVLINDTTISNKEYRTTIYVSE